jgi:IclR family acetate operon transcriptional repressor
MRNTSLAGIATEGRLRAAINLGNRALVQGTEGALSGVSPALAERLAEISAQLGLNNSTVFHLIKTLASSGMVDQLSGSKQYKIGSRLFTLAAGAMNETAMLSLATPILERLSRDTGETAHLAVRSQNEIVVIAKTAAKGKLQLSGRTGVARPAHATAIGKVLLSEIPGEDRNIILKGLVLQRFTDKTITTKGALAKELDEILKRGIGYDNCEFDDDVKCVAMPVRDFAGRCVGAIGFSGPVWRMDPVQSRRKAEFLSKAAGELSISLGFTGHAKDAAL